jgi:hypothetical protein
MAQLNIDVSTIEPREAFELLPKGRYEAMITASEECPNKAGTGSYIKLELTITDGPFAGRKVWDNLNLDNPSKKAVKIAKETLAAICAAVGINGVVRDSEDLHDKPLAIDVTQEIGGQYENNRVKAYLSLGAKQPAPAPRAAAPAAPARAARPWEKKQAA